MQARASGVAFAHAPASACLGWAVTTLCQPERTGARCTAEQPLRAGRAVHLHGELGQCCGRCACCQLSYHTFPWADLNAAPPVQDPNPHYNTDVNGKPSLAKEITMSRE